ncbi:hypothetical protein NPIL_14111 [Nephila pilipes]|uniref:Uncharacterized protein n=1 Tax=Nephila pilipes TaxID=299642 RepID=A0A8X6K7X6_NEPPI|nr:hypothetical protein NPIL_14111 [Nephila pilipes]
MVWPVLVFIVNISPHYLSLGTAKSAFDGEVEAIKVTHLDARPPLSDQAVIFSDSQAAILAIANCSQAPSSMSVMQRSLMGKMSDIYKTIALQRIPSYCVFPAMKKRMGWPKKVVWLIRPRITWLDISPPRQ